MLLHTRIVAKHNMLALTSTQCKKLMNNYNYKHDIAAES